MKALIKTWIPIFILSLAVVACSKDDDTPGTGGGNGSGNGGGNNDPIVSLEDTISGNWEVKSATHQGSPDNSSTGLQLEIRKDGSYTLVSTGFVGTWEFQNDKTQVMLDEGTQYETLWTITTITSSNLDVSFKSPFTGGASTWSMEPY